MEYVLVNVGDITHAKLLSSCVCCSRTSRV